MTRGMLPIGLAVSALVAAPAAQAATVSLSDRTDVPPRGPGAGVFYYFTATFTADPGEANDVTVRSESNPRALVFRDTGASIRPGAGCEAREDGSVACRARPTFAAPTIFSAATLRLGDGDDRAAGAGHAIDVHGGSGADLLTGVRDGNGGEGDDSLSALAAPSRLRGGPGRDTIAGSAGTDLRLDGGPGSDVIRAGDGDDQVFDGDGARGAGDIVDGGPGRDLISYSGRRTSVSLDFRRGTAQGGASGDGDLVSGFENATGGIASDRLVGDAGPNLLEGGGGRDLIDGRAGPDRLFGGLDATTVESRVARGDRGDRIVGGSGDDELSGASGSDLVAGGAGADRLKGGSGVDRLRGGNGADVLELRSGPGERPACGPGRDVVLNPSARDRPSRDCERAHSVNEDLMLDLRPRLAGRGTAVVAIRCRLRCRARVELLAAKSHRVIGEATLRARRGVRRALRVRLSAAASGALRRRGRIAAVVRVRPRGKVLDALAARVLLRR